MKNLYFPQSPVFHFLATFTLINLQVLGFDAYSSEAPEQQPYSSGAPEQLDQPDRGLG